MVAPKSRTNDCQWILALARNMVQLLHYQWVKVVHLNMSCSLYSIQYTLYSLPDSWYRFSLLAQLKKNLSLLACQPNLMILFTLLYVRQQLFEMSLRVSEYFFLRVKCAYLPPIRASSFFPNISISPICHTNRFAGFKFLTDIERVYEGSFIRLMNENYQFYVTSREINFSNVNNFCNIDP